MRCTHNLYVIRIGYIDVKCVSNYVDIHIVYMYMYLYLCYKYLYLCYIYISLGIKSVLFVVLCTTKHEQDINHHEQEHHRGYVDFVSTTCMNMRQVKPLETFKGEYHPIILHHSHLKIYVGIQDKPLYALS